jgi:tetratricopeptide (TPR) repeat protein
MSSSPNVPRAFLSHSSKDKEFVRAVALSLGRQLCVFDEQTFHSADDLRKIIVDTLASSAMFVLFASKHSLASLWCNFEQEETQWLQIRRHIKKVVTITIDNETSPGKLPEWLRHSLVRQALSAAAVAREIRKHLNSLLASTAQTRLRFVGRGHDQAQLESLLVPADSDRSPKAVLISGLHGVGRRTLVRRVGQGVLRLSNLIEVPVEETDSETELAFKLAQHAEQYNTAEGLRRIGETILKLPPNEAIQRFISDAQILTANNELVTLVDEGGLCNDEGLLVEPIQSILAALNPDEDCYLFLISRRFPKYGDKVTVPTLRLGKLPDSDMARLLKMSCADYGITLSSGEIHDLTSYLGGYPPAAYYAAQQIRAYGKELVISDKHSLVEWRASVFLAHLRRDKIGPVGGSVLAILGSLSPLPLLAVVKGVSAQSDGTPPPPSEDTIHASIRELIDRSIIEVDLSGMFSMAGPVTAAASRVFGLEMRPGVCRAVFEAITHYLAERTGDSADSVDYHEITLSLLRTQYRAAQLAGIQSTALTRLVNDTMRLADLHFATRHYDRTIDLCREVLKDRPRNSKARSILIRSYAHLEKWDLARDEISEHKKYAARSDALFLEGFVLRKRGLHNEAITKYLDSMKEGRDDRSILRELSQCYLGSGRLEDARRYIDLARAKGAMDHHIVDLWVKISLIRQDWAEAELGIRTLQKVDASQARYFHRRASLEFLRHNTDEAEACAKRSCSLRPKPFFEELAQLARIQIANRNSDEAETTIKRIDRTYPGIRTGIVCALKCLNHLARAEFEDAYMLSEHLPNKGDKYYRGIRRQALHGLINSPSTPDARRAEYVAQLNALSGTSGSFSVGLDRNADWFDGFDVLVAYEHDDSEDGEESAGS